MPRLGSQPGPSIICLFLLTFPQRHSGFPEWACFAVEKEIFKNYLHLTLTWGWRRRTRCRRWDACTRQCSRSRTCGCLRRKTFCVNVAKLFFSASLTLRHNKLVCLTLISFIGLAPGVFVRGKVFSSKADAYPQNTITRLLSLHKNIRLYPKTCYFWARPEV